MPDSFVHLHVHTEYSMLDGAAKNSKLFAEVERQGMPAVAMSDHGNMFGAYEFSQVAKDTSVKPIIGIEAYVAPGSRFDKTQTFWAPGGIRSQQHRRRGWQRRLRRWPLHAHDHVGAQRDRPAKPVQAVVAGVVRGLST